jgi:hypothetical protein
VRSLGVAANVAPRAEQSNFPRAVDRSDPTLIGPDIAGPPHAAIGLVPLAHPRTSRARALTRQTAQHALFLFGDARCSVSIKDDSRSHRDKYRGQNDGDARHMTKERVHNSQRHHVQRHLQRLRRPLHPFRVLVDAQRLWIEPTPPTTPVALRQYLHIAPCRP